MTEVYIERFGAEAHLPNQIHYQQLNKHTLSSAVDSIIEYFAPWGAGKLERVDLTPKYTLLPDNQ